MLRHRLPVHDVNTNEPVPYRLTAKALANIRSRALNAPQPNVPANQLRGGEK